VRDEDGSGSSSSSHMRHLISEMPLSVLLALLPTTSLILPRSRVAREWVDEAKAMQFEI